MFQDHALAADQKQLKQTVKNNYVYATLPLKTDVFMHQISHKFDLKKNPSLSKTPQREIINATSC